MVKTYLLVQTGSGSWHFDFQTKNAPSARRLCKILIRVDLLLVRCWTHVANLRRSYALCAARIYTWKFFCQPTKNTDTEQFSDNSLSLSTNLALIVKTPFIACLRCIRCCTTFISVLINTLGHYIALYVATIVSQEVALGLACQHLSLRHRFCWHPSQRSIEHFSWHVLGAYVVAQHLFWC